MTKSKYHTKWLANPENKAKHLLSTRRYWREIRLKVLNHYTNGKLICSKCGFSDERALTLDHINGDGGIERRKHSGKNIGGAEVYRQVIKNNYPIGFQILCMNCNMIKAKENKEHWTYRKNKVI